MHGGYEEKQAAPHRDRAPGREPPSSGAGPPAAAPVVTPARPVRNVYRYVSEDQEGLATIRPRRVLSAAEYRELTTRNLEELGRLAGRHYAGDTSESPFISLTTDFNLAAQTTDISRGGLGAIVHNAPRIACLVIPAEYCLGADEGHLPGDEGEVLVLLPPGRSLADFVRALKPNPYRYKYWNASKLDPSDMNFPDDDAEGGTH